MITNETCGECKFFRLNRYKYKKYKYHKVPTGLCQFRRGMRLTDDRACYKFEGRDKHNK